MPEERVYRLIRLTKTEALHALLPCRNLGRNHGACRVLHIFNEVEVAGHEAMVGVGEGKDVLELLRDDGVFAWSCVKVGIEEVKVLVGGTVLGLKVEGIEVAFERFMDWKACSVVGGQEGRANDGSDTCFVVVGSTRIVRVVAVGDQTAGEKVLQSGGVESEELCLLKGYDVVTVNDRFNVQDD